jgi:hypothetical protein
MSGSGALTGTTRFAMELGTMAGPSSVKTPTLHDALKALSLGSGGNVKKPDFLEDLDAKLVAYGHFALETAKFLKVTLGRDALRKLAGVKLARPGKPFMSSRPSTTASVAEGFLFLERHDVLGSTRDHGYRESGYRFVEYLGHADFLRYQTYHSEYTPWIRYPLIRGTVYP